MLQQNRKHLKGLVLELQTNAVLVYLARTKVHLIGAKARPAGLRNSFHNRLTNVATLYHNWLLIKKYVPAHASTSCNFPEFTELHRQNQDRYRPSLRHCIQTYFARLSRHRNASIKVGVS